MEKQTNEGRELARMLCGDINRVLLNGEEIRSTTYKTLRSISTVLLTHSKDPDGNPEIDEFVNAGMDELEVEGEL